MTYSLLTRHDDRSEVERQEFPREAEAVAAWHLARGLENFGQGGFVLLVKDGKLIRGMGIHAGVGQALVDELETPPAETPKPEEQAADPGPYGTGPRLHIQPNDEPPAAPQQAKPEKASPSRKPVHIPSVREVWTDKERG